HQVRGLETKGLGGRHATAPDEHQAGGLWPTVGVDLEEEAKWTPGGLLDQHAVAGIGGLGSRRAEYPQTVRNPHLLSRPVDVDARGSTLVRNQETGDEDDTGAQPFGERPGQEDRAAVGGAVRRRYDDARSPRRMFEPTEIVEGGFFSERPNCRYHGDDGQ